MQKVVLELICLLCCMISQHVGHPLPSLHCAAKQKRSKALPELGLPPTKVHRNRVPLPRLGEQHGAPLSASHQLMMRWMPDVSSSSSGQRPPLPQLGVPSKEEGMQDTCDFAGHSAALTAHSASALPLFGRLALVGMETLRFPKLRRAPPLNIVVRQVSEPFASLSRIARATSGVCPASYERIVNYYGTIRAHPGSFTSPGFMTNRNKTELPQSLLCDPVFQQAVSARGKSLHEFRAVSPHFAEWLFGFPYGWTDGTLGKCTDLATHLVSQWPQRSRKHRVASVFTGIGGLDFGLSPWVEPALYIEQDEDALAVLHARMSDGSLPCCPVVKDVCDVASANLPADIDGIVAGFPCTDTSGAGLRQGMQGAETHLVMELLRIVDMTSCTFLFLENVHHIVQMPLVYSPIFAGLQSRGFVCAWVSVSAQHVGLPMKRKRWFFYAVRHNRLPFSLADPLPEDGLEGHLFTDVSGRPAPELWMTTDSGRNVCTRLSLIGRTVIPMQAFLAARLLTSCL